MLQELFKMWLAGFMLLVLLVGIPIILIITLDFLAAAIFSTIYGEFDLIIMKTVLPEKVYEKIYNFLNGH